MLNRSIRRNQKRARYVTQLEQLEPRVLLSAAAASSASAHAASAGSSLVAAIGFTAPASPTLTSAVALSASSIQVNWVLNSSNESGVAIKKWSGSAWFTIALLPVGSSSFVDTHLTPGATYFYTVSAFNSVGESWANTYVSATTTAQAMPAAPSSVDAHTLTSTSIQVDWTLNDSTDTGVYVARWNGASWDIITTLPAGTQSFINTGLTPNATYIYDIIAFNDAGATWATNYDAATTLGAPTAPTSLSATALSATAIQVNWTLHGDESSVYVERWNGAWAVVAHLSAGTTTFVDTGLAPSTTYYYEVVAANSVGTTWAVNFTSAVTFTGGAPAPPSGLTAGAISSTTIQVNWTLGDNTDTSVYVAKWNGAQWQIVAALAGGSTVYLDSFANPGINYYEVIANNPFGSTWATFYTSAVL